MLIRDICLLPRVAGLFISLVVGALVQVDGDLRDAQQKLNTLFAEEKSNQSTSCSGISGDLNYGCYECYLCDDIRVRGNKIVKHLSLTNDNCEINTQLCCVPQLSLTSRSQETCGVKVIKHQKRRSARAVLPGEYPWRTWVYRKKHGRRVVHKILCAGTVIDQYAKVVLTSASCLQGYTPDQLGVTFSRNVHDEINIRSIHQHPSYVPSNKYANDIAILILNKNSSSAKGWGSPACLPDDFLPMHATTCLTISDTDFYLTPVIQMGKACKSNDIKAESGQMCAVAPLEDFKPEHGAALLCHDELRTGKPDYFISGIALYTKKSLTAYTNVNHYRNWIEETMTNNL